MLELGTLYGADQDVDDDYEEEEEESAPRKASPLNSSAKIFARFNEAQAEVLTGVHRDIRRDKRLVTPACRVGMAQSPNVNVLS